LRHLPANLLVASLLLFTVAMAGPTHDVRIPRNRAVAMLVIDVSQSMRATDLPPSRMAAAQDAAKQFTDELPGINLGLIAYAGTASLLESPATNRAAMKAARTAKDQGVPISIISFGTPYGCVEINGQRQPVPVDDETMKKVAELSGGTAYSASTIAKLKDVYATLPQQIGYEPSKATPVPVGCDWGR
jgi:Ca-activated chloride channel family protein